MKIKNVQFQPGLKTILGSLQNFELLISTHQINLCEIYSRSKGALKNLTTLRGSIFYLFR